MDEHSKIDPFAPSAQMSKAQLPALDLSALFESGDGPRRQAVLEQMRQACRAPGFFTISGTSIEQSSTDQVLAQMGQFFSLPDEHLIKRSVHNALSGGGTGWGPMFGEPAYQEATTAWVESFDRGPGLAGFQPDERAAAFGIYPNLWPELPGFREAVDTWYAQANQLVEVLFRAFAEMLGLAPDYLLSRTGPRAPRTMRLLRYPANDGPADRHNVGIAAHTDYECFTLMYQSAPGLELTDADGRWWQAPAGPGEMLVILGDMMEWLTNGYLRATGHRVLNTTWQRDSIILFAALNGDCEVGPLPRFVSERYPANYTPVRQSDRIKTQLAKAYGNVSAKP